MSHDKATDTSNPEDDEDVNSSETDIEEPEQRSGLDDESNHNDLREDVRGQDDPAHNANEKRSPVTGKQPRDSPIDREVRHDGEVDTSPSLADEDTEPHKDSESSDRAESQQEDTPEEE